MVSKKRGTFRIVLAIVIAIFLFSALQTAFSSIYPTSPLSLSSPARLFSISPLLPLASAEMEGCYTYAKGSESVYCKSVLESEAQKDCSKFTDCDIKERFIPGSDCSDLPECAEITCNVDCQTHPLGKCEQMGTATLPGKAVADEEYALWCDVGCCKFPQLSGKNYCTYNINRYACSKSAAQSGVTDTQKIFFDNSGTIDSDTCQKVYCGLNLLSSSIEVHVQDAEGKVLDGVTIALEGENLEKTTDTSGKASFLTLTPKNYLLKVGKEGYLSVSLAVPLAQNTTANQTVTLNKLEGTAGITGIVTGEDNSPLAKATLSWENSAKGISGKTTADDKGQYTFSNLPPGNYVVTASQLGYTPEKKPLELKEGSNSLNFMLKSAALLGVKGITYIDTNNNGKQDGEDEHPYGVKVYVDGVLRGQSQYPDGIFEFSLQVGAGTETHNISATYQNYQMEPLQFEISSEQTVTKNLFLITYVGECSKTGESPQKNVEEFLALPAVGKKEVYLSWKKPCAETIGYTLEKYSGSELLEKVSLPPTAKKYTDSGITLGALEWGKTYTYKISASYDSGLQSTQPAEQTLTLGDEACEGHYNELTDWDTFCFGGDKEIRKKVWTCNNQNQLLESDNCAEKDGPGENYYCARISSAVAECKNTGACSLNANPFGLYYGQESCYGISNYAALLDGEQEPKNYCYYDYTASVVDQCKECTEANVKSCFDYQSKDACNINSCLGKDCQWVSAASATEPLLLYDLLLPELVTPETGSGYCVEINYQKDDQCSRCSSSSGLFENYYCTPEVCSGLGDCFSANKLEYCQACGESPSKEANCYTYSSESECVGIVGEVGLQKDTFEQLTPSKDRCGWERCIWQGISGGSGSCVKDGNGDGENDCVSFESSGESSSCMKDSSAPRTIIVPEGLNIVSLAHPNLTFSGDDAYHKFSEQKNKMGKLGYCLTSADPQALDTCHADNEGTSPFVEVDYPGKLQAELLTVDVIGSPFLQGKYVNGETYKLKFYSQDKYLNQEDLQETFIYVDNVPPEFSINTKSDTQEDITTLTAYLDGTSEPMECTFSLQPVIPAGAPIVQSVEREIWEKEVTFESLGGVRYDLNVTCKDDNDNLNTKTEVLVFDQEGRIDIIYPAPYGAVAETDISFKIDTAVGATCYLYKTLTNEKVADFLSDEAGKVHYTNPVPGFFEKAYPAEYKAICQELLTSEVFEDYFNFVVDFTPPETQIILTEGKREVKPTGYGWEEFFVNSATVDFDCALNAGEGFSCAKTFYCLGAGCELIDSPDYKEHTAPFPVNETTPICYYSTDAANNAVYQPTCGKIVIDGHGLTLEKPPAYYYLGELWGISNTPEFDWQFSTKVPTSECGFDFVSGFNYETLTEHKHKTPNSENKYLFSKFPTSVLTNYPESGGIKSVYVRCKNSEEELGPEKKLYLEYDLTPPQILEAYAQPNLVLEEISTNLFAKTDDKSICRFTDNSDGDSDYPALENMEYGFPGADNHTLELLHTKTFEVGMVGDDGLRNYSLKTQCHNGAGNLSEVEDINFSVDYTQAGYIIPSSISPAYGSFISGKSVEVKLSTSKVGSCVLMYNLSTQPFESADGKAHNFALGNLPDKEYQYVAICTMGDHQAEAQIKFIVDTVAPTITNVDDGNFTCGGDIDVWTSVSEGNLSGYYYEVYDAGEDKKASFQLAPKDTGKGTNASKTNTSKSGSGTSSSGSSSLSSSTSGKTMLINGTLGPTLHLKVPASALNESHKYTVKIRAGDLAGNWGNFKESDGILVVPANYSTCKQDKTVPTVSYTKNDSCTSAAVELSCVDETGCKDVKYTKQAAPCNLTENFTFTSSYTGQKIMLEKSSWICYFASDKMGNNITNSLQITLPDIDGDGVFDKCDNCSKTTSGKQVDGTGCSSGDFPVDKLKDTDKDGLPDYWEKQYDALSCPLNYAKNDSNANGVNDKFEDYDKDSYTNHQEFTLGLNPCLADAPEKKEELGKKNETVSKKDEPKKKPGEPISALELTAWILLLAGILMIVGGTGYLVYYYRFASAAKGRGAAPSSRASSISPSSAGPAKPNLLASWQQKLFQLRQAREAKLKQKGRQEVFGAFKKESAEIPHIDKVLAKGSGQIHDKLQQVAQKYVEHKEEILPGLKHEEKSIFNKLENIATKSQDIKEVVGKQEAQDIFSKLKELSKKRKEGGK